ncbi:pleckstrin homology domain-containing family A member 1-like isoform X2 [Ostrea edulis]|uniref:pleckstrin homology domain-containing family A member 1-like isoform X2 n=1 Tax=Ostrea edulis TaxID=37623 RepID=UPI0020941E01|nr:pleckstrin homology domain-containing family A member 1-like isoform X2 [Ostrea edulis]
MQQQETDQHAARKIMDINMPYQDKQGRTCGFLNILEKESSTSSKRRYFILEPHEESLKFYIDNPNNLPPDQQSPCGEISTAVISKVSEVSKKQKPKLDSLFVINHAGKAFYLQAESTEDMHGWVYALNNVSKITVPEEKSKNLNDPEAGYKTEIAGGVPIKIPIKNENANESGASSDSEENAENPKTTAALQVALKKGYCVKQGGVRKNWKRRYFVVNNSGLAYYTHDQSEEPLRLVPRSDITDVRKAPVSPGVRDNLFEVATTKRTFYIQCDTPEDVQEWVLAIEKLINNQASQRRSGGNIDPNEVDLSVTKVFPQNKWKDTPVKYDVNSQEVAIVSPPPEQSESGLKRQGSRLKRKLQRVRNK